MILPLLIAAMEFVKISDSLTIGKTEVTQLDYGQVMKVNPSHFRGPDLPVENVNYDDVIKFIDKLNAKSPLYRYRLPSNAEWTLAASGGAKTRYFFGDKEEELGLVAWYRGNTTQPKEVKPGDWQSVGGSTHPVGQKMANQFGLHDTHGNIWEFTQEGSIRGGCWWSTALDCSTGYVSKWDKATRCEYVGFRLVRTAKEKKK
jgi:formylglycine-generating enzyme required for sulfatase activity